jgi:hypothetical protein
MVSRYFETRAAQLQSSPAPLVNDMVRHFNTRQYVGKTIVICDNPFLLMRVARKQWLKITRTIQRRRAATLNADMILKFSYTITHMQQLRFTTKSPFEDLEATMYFMEARHIEVPPECMSIYVTIKLTENQAMGLIGRLSQQCLIVDYCDTAPWENLGLLPKKQLELQVKEDWQVIKTFFEAHKLDLHLLSTLSSEQPRALDDALDTLLDASGEFIAITQQFEHTLELARPLLASKELRQQYDIVTLLAYRVQALVPGYYTQQFLKNYAEDDVFLLNDRTIKNALQAITKDIQKHHEEGRVQLAEKLSALAHARPILCVFLFGPNGLKVVKN